jgi:hypothetical protein
VSAKLRKDLESAKFFSNFAVAIPEGRRVDKFGCLQPLKKTLKLQNREPMKALIGCSTFFGNRK